MKFKFKNLSSSTKSGLSLAATYTAGVILIAGLVNWEYKHAIQYNKKGIEQCLDPVVGHTNFTYFNKYGTNMGKVELEIHDQRVIMNFSGQGGFPSQKYDLIYTHVGLFDPHTDEYNLVVAKAINKHLTDSSGKFNSQGIEGQFWDGPKKCSPGKIAILIKEREEILKSKLLK